MSAIRFSSVLALKSFAMLVQFLYKASLSFYPNNTNIAFNKYQQKLERFKPESFSKSNSGLFKTFLMMP